MAWRARLALVRAQNEAALPPSRRSTAPPHGQYLAKVWVLGSAIALPNPFIMMGNGPEEVSDLLGARSLHIHLHPHAHCQAQQGSKAHARHVEPNCSNGAGSSTVMACKSGMRGGTGAEVRHRRWFDDPGCHGAMHGRVQRAMGRSARRGLGARLSPIPGGSSSSMGRTSSIQGAAGWEGGEGACLCVWR